MGLSETLKHSYQEAKGAYKVVGQELKPESMVRRWKDLSRDDKVLLKAVSVFGGEVICQTGFVAAALITQKPEVAFAGLCEFALASPVLFWHAIKINTINVDAIIEKNKSSMN